MYNVMTWYNPILTPDSLWPVWADTDMLETLDILTLAPDSCGPSRQVEVGLFTMVIQENTAQWVS